LQQSAEVAELNVWSWHFSTNRREAIHGSYWWNNGRGANMTKSTRLMFWRWPKISGCEYNALGSKPTTREEVMKQYLGLGLGLIAGTMIGAAAISGLHAQAKPPVYLITEIDVTNPEAYGKEFAPLAQATIKAAGAKFLIIGGTAGAGAKPVNAIAGTAPKRVTIQVWDSLEAIDKWYKSADYQAALKIGEKYATFRRYAVEGQ